MLITLSRRTATCHFSNVIAVRSLHINNYRKIVKLESLLMGRMFFKHCVKGNRELYNYMRVDILLYFAITCIQTFFLC